MHKERTPDGSMAAKVPAKIIAAEMMTEPIFFILLISLLQIATVVLTGLLMYAIVVLPFFVPVMVKIFGRKEYADVIISTGGFIRKQKTSARKQAEALNVIFSNCFCTGHGENIRKSQLVAFQFEKITFNASACFRAEVFTIAYMRRPVNTTVAICNKERTPDGSMAAKVPAKIRRRLFHLFNGPF
jgi:hypothetical protein